MGGLECHELPDNGSERTRARPRKSARVNYSCHVASSTESVYPDFMVALRRFLDAPLTELAVGLVLLAAGLLELRDILLVKLPNKGPMPPHAAAAKNSSSPLDGEASGRYISFRHLSKCRILPS
jgi:hypothetical protein